MGRKINLFIFTKSVVKYVKGIGIGKVFHRFYLGKI